MLIETAIATVSAVVATLSNGTNVLKFLQNKSSEAREAVRALPVNASPQLILESVRNGVGGDLSVIGGDGHVHIENAYLSAGNGSRKGGDTVIQAGPGGMTIIGGTIKGGDAGQ